jgi:phosphatidylglycerol:prolipoprotein diacylglycerol transferase
MLPYVHVRNLHLFGITIHPFGVLVAAAVLVGIALAKRRARLRGFDVTELESFVGFCLVCGFASAHILDEILYRPREVLERPWSLLFLWDGIGSFSGWLGALAGVVLWKRFQWRPLRTFGPWKVGPFTAGRFSVAWLARRKKTLPILPFADIVLSVFPVAWIFGRAGCSVVHDHPGKAAPEPSVLSVAFPSPDPVVIDGAGVHHTFGPVTVIDGGFPRYDLGTLELAFTIVIAAVFVVLSRRRLFTGTYVVLVSLAYAPARFAMDTLRVGDVRYGGLTPGQWMCIALFVFGLALLGYVLRLRARGADPARSLLAPPPP